MLYTVFLIIIFTLFAFLTWHNFRAGLLLFCGLFPTYLLRFSLGPLPTTALEIFFLILFTIWLLRNNQPLGLVNAKGWFLAISLLFVTACLATIHAPNTLAALGILRAYYLEPIALIAILLSTFRKHEDWVSAFVAVTASAVIIAILGVIQYLTTLGLPTAWLAEHRITSIFDFPNAVGLFLAPILSMLIATIFTWWKQSNQNIKTPKHKLIYKIATVLSVLIILVAIVLAKTEAALIAIPAALFITFLVSNAHRTTKLVSTALIIIIFIGAFSVPSIKEKILLQDISGQARTQSWHETLTLLNNHPLLGAGLSGFPSAIAPYHNASYFEIFQYPHNIFLNIWVELGFPGLIAFFIISFLTLKTLFQHRTNPMSPVILAAFLTIFIHGLVDVPFFKNDLAMLTAVLLTAAVYLSNQQIKA